MDIRVHLRHLHIAPRKVRALAGLIRGMSADEALRQLRHEPRRSAGPLAKLLAAAVAGAKHDFHAEASTLTVREVRVDPGPVTKKFRPRAFGRAAPIRRRTSHISLKLFTEAAPVARTAKKEEPLVLEAEDAERRMRAQASAVKARPGATEPDGKVKAAKPKPTGFIRRIFQRKAI